MQKSYLFLSNGSSASDHCFDKYRHPLDILKQRMEFTCGNTVKATHRDQRNKNS